MEQERWGCFPGDFLVPSFQSEQLTAVVCSGRGHGAGAAHPSALFASGAAVVGTAGQGLLASPVQAGWH